MVDNLIAALNLFYQPHEGSTCVFDIAHGHAVERLSTSIRDV